MFIYGWHKPLWPTAGGYCSELTVDEKHLLFVNALNMANGCTLATVHNAMLYLTNKLGTRSVGIQWWLSALNYLGGVAGHIERSGIEEKRSDSVG